MKQVQVTVPFMRIHSGVLGLSAEQARSRAHALEVMEDGTHRVLSPVGFKFGEVFSMQGQVPKTQVSELVSVIEEALSKVVEVPPVATVVEVLALVTAEEVLPEVPMEEIPEATLAPELCAVEAPAEVSAPTEPEAENPLEEVFIPEPVQPKYPFGRKPKGQR